MSRALDAKTKAAIQNGDHTEAFRELSGVLARCYDVLFDIELIGPELMMMLPDPKCYFLLDGNTLIIPKLRVVQAFIVAKKLLFKYREDTSSVTREELSASTRVILLMDAEHLTAANTRKRQIIDSGYDLDTIRRELSFVDSLLKSDLHRHNKSPTLWNHRHWLMAKRLNHYDEEGKLTTKREYDYILTEDLLERHFKSVIFLSGERHPKNYYAWAHARQLLLMASEAGRRALLPATRDWCWAHRGDISGWAFLVSLPVPVEEQKAVLVETMKNARTFRYDNESVWWYFAAMASSPEELAELRTLREKLLPEAEEKDRLHLDRALKWLRPSST
jgi:hypothetical protein